MDAGQVPTRTSAKIAQTVLKTGFAGKVSTAFLFRMSILSSICDTLTSRVRVAITADLDTRRKVTARFKGYGRLIKPECRMRPPDRAGTHADSAYYDTLAL